MDARGCGWSSSALASSLVEERWCSKTGEQMLAWLRMASKRVVTVAFKWGGDELEVEDSILQIWLSSELICGGSSGTTEKMRIEQRSRVLWWPWQWVVMGVSKGRWRSLGLLVLCPVGACRRQPHRRVVGDARVSRCRYKRGERGRVENL